MTKGNIIGGISNIDCAMPVQWTDKAKELGIDPFWYAMDYRDNSLGRPLNLLEIYVARLEQSSNEMTKQIHELHMELLELKKK